LGKLKQIDQQWFEEALAFCQSKPTQTAYVASWITEKLNDHPQSKPGWLLAEFDQSHKIVGLAYISETGILFPVLHSDESFEQIEAIARANPGMLRVILGHKSLVDILWPRLEKQGLRARMNQLQVMYTVDRHTFLPCENPLELTMAIDLDVDDIVKASALMAKEESKDDAQARNPRLFRARIETRLKKNRDFIYRSDGHFCFKASVSALAEQGGQLEGIYTLPNFRRQGLALSGTSSMTAWILQRAERALLLVNKDNAAAKKIYEALGYKIDHESRTIFIKG
jgi:predicted GNAT family acetyltransferase